MHTSWMKLSSSDMAPKTKRDVTSSIGTYKPGEVNVRQVLGVDELLQGRVSGVNITSASGVPGSKNRVSIRGIGSITAGNETTICN